MKVKDLLLKYDTEYERLKKIANDYYSTHYCGYMGEWINGSEEEHNKLKQDVDDFFNSEVIL